MTQADVAAREEAAELIDDYSQHLLTLYQINKFFFQNLNLSPLVNFRDALAHYVKMYEAKDSSTIHSQILLINDHLDRGYKDQILFLLHYLAIKLHLMLEPPKGEILLLTGKSQIQLVRKWLHALKNAVLQIRQHPDQYSYSSNGSKIMDCNELIRNLMGDLDSQNLKTQFLSDRDLESLTYRYKQISGVK